MKKLYVFMTALLAMFAVNANADRILYSENYEAGAVPATWTKNGSTTTLTIAGDSEGKYISFNNVNDNGRSAHCLWGEAIFDSAKEGLTEYSVSIDFQFEKFSNAANTKSQYNGEVQLQEMTPTTHIGSSMAMQQIFLNLSKEHGILLFLPLILQQEKFLILLMILTQHCIKKVQRH